jgi:hypothetical protein
MGVYEDEQGQDRDGDSGHGETAHAQQRGEGESGEQGRQPLEVEELLDEVTAGQRQKPRQ